MTILNALARLLSPADLARVERLSGLRNDRMEVVATRLGLCSEPQLAAVIASVCGLPLADPATFPDQPQWSDRVSSLFLRANRAIAVKADDNELHIAMADPFDLDVIAAIQFAAERVPAISVATPTDIEAAWMRMLDDPIDPGGEAAVIDDSVEDVERLRDMASEAPVIHFVQQMIADAIDRHASDIHVEPMGQHARVRMRLDGRLYETGLVPVGTQAAVVSRLKIMAKLNIAERRLPQDGRFRLTLRGGDIDLRVATTPTLHGEAVVLRILDASQVKLDLDALGFPAPRLAQLRRLLALPHGIVLVTGPTGSGKTTTLYSGLAEINTEDRKVLTIEDPIEVQLPGANQVQMRASIGLTFAAALRTFLRHDPDIVLVGEIRDLETAQTAVQAALTGHLILSTLHTNDAAASIPRLLDMGIEDFLVASTLHGIVAQRLVRVLCTECRRQEAPVVPPPTLPPDGFHVAVGCAACGHTGYRGRTVISELMVMNDLIRRLITRRAGSDELRRQAVQDGMVTLYEDGLDKASRGITSIDEVRRACMEA